MYQGDEMSEGYLRSFTISGTTDGEEYQVLATGMFKEDDNPQYVFWKKGKYTQIKMEIDDLWPSEDNSAHIAELMLVVPPDSATFETVEVEGLVAGGLPDADYPLLPFGSDSSDSTEENSLPIADFGNHRYGQRAKLAPAKVFVRNHEVLIFKNGEVFRINGVR
jgi:hypothetical protein